jgi:hypothetical protein
MQEECMQEECMTGRVHAWGAVLKIVPYKLAQRSRQTTACIGGVYRRGVCDWRVHRVRRGLVLTSCSSRLGFGAGPRASWLVCVPVGACGVWLGVSYRSLRRLVGTRIRCRNVLLLRTSVNGLQASSRCAVAELKRPTFFSTCISSNDYCPCCAVTLRTVESQSRTNSWGAARLRCCVALRIAEGLDT